MGPPRVGHAGSLILDFRHRGVLLVFDLHVFVIQGSSTEHKNRVVPVLLLQFFFQSYSGSSFPVYTLNILKSYFLFTWYIVLFLNSCSCYKIRVFEHYPVYSNYTETSSFYSVSANVIFQIFLEKYHSVLLCSYQPFSLGTLKSMPATDSNNTVSGKAIWVYLPDRPGKLLETIEVSWVFSEDFWNYATGEFTVLYFYIFLSYC